VGSRSGYLLNIVNELLAAVPYLAWSDVGRQYGKRRAQLRAALALNSR
jgi:hypothetical protein